MKNVTFILFIFGGVTANAQQGQITNQYALTSAGGYQGQIGNYHFDFSLGELFTTTGHGASLWNTPGIVQPVLSEVALPVTLVSFEAEKSEKNALLKWTTTEEVNSDRFEIQRSQNGKRWSTIGTVDAGGNINHTRTHYQFADTLPLSGPNLYRLKMIDLDQTFAFSHVVSLAFQSTFSTILYPNPAFEKVSIRADNNDQIKAIRVHDIRGKCIYSSDSFQPEIDLKQFIPGLHILTLVRKNGEQTNHKLLIAK